ncbi:MAG: hypothetical protein ACI88C_002875 [Acidimicrobiales bacterium]|jgi:hypothetical protein
MRQDWQLSTPNTLSSNLKLGCIGWQLPALCQLRQRISRFLRSHCAITNAAIPPKMVPTLANLIS